MGEVVSDKVGFGCGFSVLVVLGGGGGLGLGPGWDDQFSGFSGRVPKFMVCGSAIGNHLFSKCGHCFALG